MEKLLRAGTTDTVSPSDGTQPPLSVTVPRKLIAATELAEFVYCAKAWELKYVQGAESSAETQQLQVEGNAWHAAQGRQLARSDSFRRPAFIALDGV